MIPRNTPIGAELVRINTRSWFHKGASPGYPAGPRQLDGLTEGRYYRLRAYAPCDELAAGFRVHVEEILRPEDYDWPTGVTVEVGFAPQRFKVLETQQKRKATQRSVAPPVRVRELELA